MNQIFGGVYAKAYDILYREKDYDGECKLLEEIFQRFGAKPVQSVLDLGCGTGNHALRLADKGYRVMGVERSADMLCIARRKSQERPSLRWHQADIRAFKLEETFDAALMMFAVLSYQQGKADVLDALRIVRRHVIAGGLLVFDVWYGPAVLAQQPEDRIKTLKTEDGMVSRTSSATLDTEQQLCAVNFQLQCMTGSQVLEETRETHSMRYFFRQELALLLEASGFRLLQFGGFPDLDSVASEATWNVTVVARSV